MENLKHTRAISARVLLHWNVHMRDRRNLCLFSGKPIVDVKQSILTAIYHTSTILKTRLDVVQPSYCPTSWRTSIQSWASQTAARFRRLLAPSGEKLCFYSPPPVSAPYPLSELRTSVCCSTAACCNIVHAPDSDSATAMFCKVFLKVPPS